MVLASLLSSSKRIPGAGGLPLLVTWTSLGAPLFPTRLLLLTPFYLICGQLPRNSSSSKLCATWVAAGVSRELAPQKLPSLGGGLHVATVSTIPERWYPLRGELVAGEGVRHPGAAAPEPQYLLEPQFQYPQKYWNVRRFHKPPSR